MTLELAATLLAVARSYIGRGMSLPDHLRADLADIRAADDLPIAMRTQAHRFVVYRSTAQRAR